MSTLRDVQLGKRDLQQTMTIGDQLELFFGEASDAEARVYGRLTGDEFVGCRITGRLVGPECRFAQTLPAAIPFRERDGGPAALAEAIVPDSCFWTPELPFLYRAQLEVNRSDAVEKVDRLFGIRRLGCWRQSLYLDAKRWVARGAIREGATLDDLPAARAAGAVLYVPSADHAFYLEASRIGVPLIVDVPISGNLKSEISNLARWPAVFIALLDASAAVDERVAALAPNLLLGAKVSDPASVPAWAKVIICSARALVPARRDQCHPEPPIVVVGGDKSARDIAMARAQCDRLQRELAPIGDFAGYLVR
jgi:hypothetical protein